MATLLLSSPAEATSTVLGTAEVVIVLSPIRGADGQLRVSRRTVDAGQSLSAVLPRRQTWSKVIVNGRVLGETERSTRDNGAIHREQAFTWDLQPGDEVLAIPTWGLVEGVIAGLLVNAAIGLAVSAAVTGLTYLLFPPNKPTMQSTPEDPTFSFEGIRTTIGPGGVVPVVYGHQRIGGQLLSGAVDEVLTVVDNGQGERRVTAVASSSTLSLLIALCEGPIDAVETDTIELNGQPIANFPTAQAFVRLGTADQAPMPEFLETRNTFAVGSELSNQSVIYTTTAPVNAFTLNLAFLEGLFFMSRHGEKETNSSFLEYRFRLTENPGTPGQPGPWSPYFQYRVDADRTAPVRFGIRREGLFLGVWDIEVFWASAWNTDETRSKWLPTLVSITEIQSNTTAFPYTALLGIRAVATDQLQGGIPNITVKVRGRVVRINTFTPTETYTDNPAWCILDAMTNPRYGLGASGSSQGLRGIADGDIDLGAFATWADYCDQDIGERRHTFNYVLDREIRAQPFLLETMGGSRTMMVQSGGLWQPRPTRDAPPTQLLTWSNVTNVTISYVRDPDRINVMEARYDNEENGFQTDVLTWPTTQNQPPDPRKMSLDMRGVTKPSRVMRALQFELNRRRYENVQLSLDASLEAITFSVHDLFRFAHPLPGWAASGRLRTGSNQEHLILDEDVTLTPGLLYHVYVRHANDATEVVPVVNTGGTRSTLDLAAQLAQIPAPRESLWVLGTYTAQADLAGRVFRATKVQRKSDTTVHIEAVIHNPSIFDEADAVPLPVITTLYNPLGPAPPLTTLIATEVTRIQPSGASLRVVNLSWDVASLVSGYAPYGGAEILRRSVAEGSSGGAAVAGQTDFGAIQDPTDPNFSFVPLARVSGHVMDFDDYTVITGGTYVYRVVPISQRGVANNIGFLETTIHIAGPTTAGYFPGVVRNLRLKGQAVGVTTFDGRDIHIEWEPVADSPLFNDTFFVQDYIVQVWAPYQQYVMRTMSVPARAPGQTLDWSYTYSMNQEDNLAVGVAGARRDVWIYVWARTNTNRQSLDASILTISNPPPDMSEILPDARPLFQAGIVEWRQWVEPRDFDHYVVYLDIVNPPLLISQDLGIAFRKLLLSDLAANIPYYVQIEPWDTFGVGLPSVITSFTPAAIDATSLDTTPPGLPTGLSLSTGSTVSPDGTIVAWVQASWTASPEPDIAGYEVHFRVAPSLVPSVFTVGPAETKARLESVPGNVTIFCRFLTFDQFHNTSPFTAEVSIVTARDTVPPLAPANLLAVGSIRAVHLFWTPPPDADYLASDVWSAPINNRASAVVVGSGEFSFNHGNLGPNDTRYYWLQARDTSGNLSTAFHPASATAGVSGTAGLLDTTYISSLAADKIIAGTINVLVRLGVANRITLDGVNQAIVIQDLTGQVRGLFGKLGALSNAWGLQLFKDDGTLMWNFTDGAQTAGIADTAITAQKIAVAQIQAEHLITNTAVIKFAAQIENALITDAHIVQLRAGKIASGTISSAFIFLGGQERLLLDGVNDILSVRDANGAYRVWLGRIGSLSTDYGLRIFDTVGNVMWDLNGGASSFGVQDLAITAAKIASASITTAKIADASIISAKIASAQILNAHIRDLEVDTLKIANGAVLTGKIGANAVTESLTYTNLVGTSTSSATEQNVGFVVFPELHTGDQVWLVATGTCTTAGGAGATVRLREDSVTGAGMYDVDVGANAVAPLTAQGVYASPSDQFNKAFVLTLRSSTGSDTVSFTKIKLVSLRLQR